MHLQLHTLHNKVSKFLCNVINFDKSTTNTIGNNSMISVQRPDFFQTVLNGEITVIENELEIQFLI